MRCAPLAILLCLTGCTYFKHHSVTHSLASGAQLTLSHTQVCWHDHDPITVVLSSPPRSWSLLNAANTSVQTGEGTARFELPVKDLAVSRYRLVVKVSETESLEAELEVSSCVYL